MNSVADIDQRRKALRLLHSPAKEPKRVQKTDDERLLVALRRAVLDYASARSSFDNGRGRPLDEEVALLLFADTSGEVRVYGFGKKRSIRVLSFHQLGACVCRQCGGKTAIEIVDAARSALEVRASERDRLGVRISGDPRRGKRRTA